MPEWTLADRLRKARESAGLEQTELAELAGISRATISAAENGARPARATLRLWALATGVPVTWLETGQPDREHGHDTAPSTSARAGGLVYRVPRRSAARA